MALTAQEEQALRTMLRNMGQRDYPLQVRPLYRRKPVGDGAGATTAWAKVLTIHDNPPHVNWGRCLSMRVQLLHIPSISAPTPGDSLSWTDDGAEITAFPDPVIMDALDRARADPDGLGTAIYLDDYYTLDQIYKVTLLAGSYIALREPFAILSVPEYH